MQKIFGENGYLSKIHNNYEFREVQTRMADFIMERLLDHENALIEAGTGTGKTLAYLVPALIYSIENDKIVAVSTETKALQKQLVDKDIPLAKKIIHEYTGKDFKHSLCLGSNNYPCRKRFENLLLKGGFDPADEPCLESLKNAFSGNSVFSRFNLSVSNRIWDEIYRESEVCNAYRCPFSSKCIYQRAKKEWASSNILIMNHYLFFSNISSGKAYLPKFDIIIFDEAHSIEEIASDQLGFIESYDQIIELIAILYKKTRKNSLLNNIYDESLKKKAIGTATNLLKELNGFFEKLRGMFKENQTSIRIRESLPSGDIQIKYIKELLSILEKSEDDFKTEPLNIEFEIARGKLFNYQQNLESFIFQHNPNFVYWTEKSDDMLGDIQFYGRPVDVSQTMHHEINTFYDSSIFISATLTARKEFSFIADRLGIYDYKPLLLDSPFDYKNQVALYLDKENINPDDSQYIAHAANLSAEIIKAVGGNCLMLFTSYRMLNLLKEKLSGLVDNPIYAQGESPASETVDRYIKDKKPVLMGTHSFWQGIDLPGDLLRGVIMMRLPFGVPDRPLFQARIEKIIERGLNPFSSYQVPNAVIKFKQGFGRLIRSKDDSGVVAVLDPRILTKGYGKIFLDSLPECKIIRDIDELRQNLTASPV